MSTESADPWKKKYFTSLENLESKEHALSEIEELLRLALSRLTLAAEGVDKELDRQLAELRKSARGTFDKQRLVRAIEAISETVKHLDRKNFKQAKSGNSEPESNNFSDSLIAILDVVHFPKGIEKKVKETRKQLTEVIGVEKSKQQETLFVRLIDECLQILGDSSAASVGQSEKQSGSEERTVKTEAISILASESKAGLSLGKELLIVLVRELLQEGPGDSAFARIHKQLQNVNEEQELRTLAQEMATLMATTNGVSRETKRLEFGKATPQNTLPTNNEILIHLLDNIAIPEELNLRAADIKERLSKGIDPGKWTEVIEDLAGMIAAIRSRIESEKSELESFLLQLTGRLQELDHHLRGAEALRTDTQSRSRALDAAVHAQMDGIESSVHGASNLLELKASIQERLEHIKAHFESHRQTEGEQQAALQSQLAKATSRLNVLEGEAGRLRMHLQAQKLQATMDTLTNLPNRLAYDARLDQEYARWKRHKVPLTLLVMDVDRFKQINDSYGHKAGDKALKLIAFVLKQTVRETDFIARYGGEEFVAIISDTSTAAVMKVAEKMRASVQAADFHHNKQRVDITISIGVSSFRDSDTAEKVFLRADKALYQAKRQGRNRCVDDSSLTSSDEGM